MQRASCHGPGTVQPESKARPKMGRSLEMGFRAAVLVDDDTAQQNFRLQFSLRELEKVLSLSLSLSLSRIPRMDILPQFRVASSAGGSGFCA